MFKIMLVSPDKNSFSDFVISLNQNADADIIHVDSGESALKMISSRAVDLVVADEVLGDMTNLEFASKLVKINPMINCALVSDLAPEAFHEASEGLGIMCKLPSHPGKSDAVEMIGKLRTITQVMQ